MLFPGDYEKARRAILAIEIMERRNWGVMPCRSVIGWWVCKDSEGTPFRDDAPRIYETDPVTALIAADEWLAAQEKGRTS